MDRHRHPCLPYFFARANSWCQSSSLSFSLSRGRFSTPYFPPNQESFPPPPTNSQPPFTQPTPFGLSSSSVFLSSRGTPPICPGLPQLAPLLFSGPFFASRSGTTRWNNPLSSRPPSPPSKHLEGIRNYVCSPLVAPPFSF